MTDEIEQISTETSLRDTLEAEFDKASASADDSPE